MNYLTSLKCKTEPFTSPSGKGIFLSQAVRDAFEKLSHNILLGAGLQLVIGADGLGKTTLLNQLSQKFSADNKTVVLLLNNPQFRDLQQFLITVAGVFKTIKAATCFDDNLFQKAFNNFFYKLCLEEKKTVLLLIDNGQNLPDFCLNALNSFYDHHPDCRSLLQIVICCEPSLQRKINANKSLNSLVGFTTVLKPLGFKDTRKFILFHQERTAVDPGFPPAIFSVPAQWAIYYMTQGHPKKIIDLYHFIVRTLAIEKRKKVGWFMTLRCAKLLIPHRAKKLQIIQATSLSSLVVIILVLGLWSEQIKTLIVPQPGPLLEVTAPQRVQPPEPQPREPVKVTQKTIPPEHSSEAPPTVIEVMEETPPAAILTEELSAGVTPAENSAAVPDQPKDKASSAQVPVLESVTVIPAVKARRQVKPGDTFLGMIQQIYGPDYVKKQYVDQVIAANPHLRDFKSLKIGDEVFFPVLIQEEAKPPLAATASESQAATEVVPEPQQDDSPYLIDKPVEPPEYLGDIITASGETFGDMVRRIYGPWSFNSENVKTVMAVNPNLKSPELLYVGYKVRFPTIPVALTSKAEEVWWVRITTLDNIQDAYRFLRKYRKSSPPLLIIPSRDDSGRVLMNILLEEYFVDKESAQKGINALPAEISAQVQALHGLSPATFYYRLKQND